MNEDLFSAYRGALTPVKINPDSHLFRVLMEGVNCTVVFPSVGWNSVKLHRGRTFELGSEEYVGVFQVEVIGEI